MLPYQPPHQKVPTPTGEPTEIDLLYNVTACGTCDFFWPEDPSQQPYGPYPSFDLTLDKPLPPDPAPETPTFLWAHGRTEVEAFPTPEALNGCRKAPIMTIGINPNLTAFAPGPTGASWAYPNFQDDPVTDLWAKYAYYYRYRTVFQERFDLDFVKQYLVADEQVVAPRAGQVVSAVRPTSAPSYEVRVLYDGDPQDTVITLNRDLGTPRWVLLVNFRAPNNRFAAGDVIAARLNVPAGQDVDVHRDQVGYYEQFVPVLGQFNALLQSSGHPNANLRIGEDVCQLDMVACASPHWNPGFLGGTDASEQTIVDNCVGKNAWAMKQLVQTRPAILYLVGESTWHMFRDAFGALVTRDVPLSPDPVDNAFTLLSETCDPAHPAYFKLDVTVDGAPYSLSTRVVITPHFSYSTNFEPQIRLAPTTWQALQQNDAACAKFLTTDPRIVYVPGQKADEDYTGFLIQSDAAGLLTQIDADYPASAALLRAGFYDPHAMMSGILAEMYAAGQLSYGAVAPGAVEALTRTDGPCRFCVNDRWQFPEGCPYGKPEEPPLPPGYLESVAEAAVASGGALPTK
jgi:hypothetical protein